MSESLGWSSLLLLPEGIPTPVVFLIAMVLFVAVILFPLSFLFSFAERKLVADLQARVGPNRAGAHGLLQAPADLLKELARTAPQRPTRRKSFWQGVFVIALYSSLGALPLGADLIAVDSEISALLPLLSFSVAVLAMTLTGLESHRYEEMLASLRQGYQHWSALIPALVSVLAVGIVAESLDWRRIGEAQSAGLITALVFQQPLLLFAFGSFQLSGMILLGVPPFQAARTGRALQDAQGIGAFHEFYAFFAWCILSAALFLGGWEFLGLSEPGPVRSAIGIASVLFKAGVLFLGSKVVARALPQLRQDQMTDFAWKVLSPLAIGTLVLCALMKTIGGAA